MEKIKVNNQVVLMRKFVKQGKIHFINKFVKEIRKLEQRINNQRGSELKLQKFGRKKERLIADVTVLKKITPDSVSRTILTQAKDTKSILKMVNPSSEDRCFALLASYDPVQQATVQFFNENSKLIPSIASCVKDWEERKDFAKRGGKKSNPKAEKDAILKFKSVLEEGKKSSVPIGNSTSQGSNRNKTVNKRENIFSDNATVRTKSNKECDTKFQKIQNQIEVKRATLKNIETERSENEDLSALKECDQEEVANTLLAVTNKKECSNENYVDSEDDTSRHDDVYECDGKEKQDKSKLSSLNLNQKKRWSSGAGACVLLHPNIDMSGSESSSESDDESEINADDSDELFDSESEDDKTEVPSSSCSTVESNIKKLSNNSPNSTAADSKLLKLPVVQEKSHSISSIADDSKSLKLPVVEEKSHTISSIAKNSEQPKLSRIQEKLQAVAGNVKLKRMRSSTGKEKAIKVINMEELEDEEEISVQNCEISDEEEEDPSKPKKDSFFIRDGEEISEEEVSEGEENQNRRTWSPSSKRKPFGEHSKSKREFFGNRSFGENSKFQKRDFQEDSQFPNRKMRRAFAKNDKMGNFHQKRKMENFRPNDRSQGFKRNENWRKRESDAGFGEGKRFKGSDSDGFRNPRKMEHSKEDRFDNSSQNNRYFSLPKQKPDFNKTAKPDDKPLHPSWEAKRKMKNTENVKFQGKRIVFDT